MAHGDLTGTLEATTAPLAIDSNDELNELATTINGIITTCQTSIDPFNAAQRAVLALVGDTTRLIGAAEAGTPSVRGDTTTPQGSYRDVTARMNGTYAGDYVLLQQVLNDAVANLDQVLAEVAASAEQVAGAATEISSGSDALAHGAADQAASPEATTSSLTELASMARQNASHARDARALATSARDMATHGVEEMIQLSTEMQQITRSSAETAKIVRTIDEVAFQTNLLALNAAVEAAKNTAALIEESVQRRHCKIWFTASTSPVHAERQRRTARPQHLRGVAPRIVHPPRNPPRNPQRPKPRSRQRFGQQQRPRHAQR